MHNSQQGNRLSPQVSNIEGSSSPPIPAKNNIRHRVELDSVSPGVQRPNPMEEVVSPVAPSSPNRANFSYPARAPPQGVPRQVPVDGMPPQQQQAGVPPVPPVPGQQQQRRSSIPQLPAHQQQQSGMPPPMPSQQPSSIPPSLQSGINSNPNNDPNRPVPYRAGHDLNKQSTMANLKAAAAGIHVSPSNRSTTHTKTY